MNNNQQQTVNSFASVSYCHCNSTSSSYDWVDCAVQSSDKYISTSHVSDVQCI